MKGTEVEMRMNSDGIDAKSTLFWQLKARGAMLKVATLTGWESDICRIEIEEKLPGGLWVSQDEKEFFIPFSSIDHFQVFGRKRDM